MSGVQAIDNTTNLQRLQERQRRLEEERKAEVARRLAELQMRQTMIVGARPGPDSAQDDYEEIVSKTKIFDTRSSTQMREENISPTNMTLMANVLKRSVFVVDSSKAKIDESDPAKESSWDVTKEDGEAGPSPCGKVYGDDDECNKWYPGSRYVPESVFTAVKSVTNDSDHTIGVWLIDAEVNCPISIPPIYRERIKTLEDAYKGAHIGESNTLITDEDDLHAPLRMSLVAIIPKRESRSMNLQVHNNTNPFFSSAEGESKNMVRAEILNNFYIRTPWFGSGMSFSQFKALIEDVKQRQASQTEISGIPQSDPMIQFLDRNWMDFSGPSGPNHTVQEKPVDQGLWWITNDNLDKILNNARVRYSESLTDYLAAQGGARFAPSKPYTHKVYVAPLDGENWAANPNEGDERVNIVVELEEHYDVAVLPANKPMQSSLVMMGGESNYVL